MRAVLFILHWVSAVITWTCSHIWRCITSVRLYILVAKHNHIFWSCKAVSDYLENSMRELSNILNISLNKNPLVLLLGKIPGEIKKKDDFHFFLVIRVAIIKQITRNW